MKNGNMIPGLSILQIYAFTATWLRVHSLIIPGNGEMGEWGKLSHMKVTGVKIRNLVPLKMLESKMNTVRVSVITFRVLRQTNMMMTGTTLAPLRGKINVSHTPKTGLWYLSGVSFKISNHRENETSC